MEVGDYLKSEVFRLLGLLDQQEDDINVLRTVGTYWQFDYQSTRPPAEKTVLCLILCWDFVWYFSSPLILCTEKNLWGLTS